MRPEFAIDPFQVNFGTNSYGRDSTRVPDPMMHPSPLHPPTSALHYLQRPHFERRHAPWPPRTTLLRPPFISSSPCSRSVAADPPLAFVPPAQPRRRHVATTTPPNRLTHLSCLRCRHHFISHRRFRRRARLSKPQLSPFRFRQAQPSLAGHRRTSWLSFAAPLPQPPSPIPNSGPAPGTLRSLSHHPFSLLPPLALAAF